MKQLLPLIRVLLRPRLRGVLIRHSIIDTATLLCNVSAEDTMEIWKYEGWLLVHGVDAAWPPTSEVRFGGPRGTLELIYLLTCM